MTVNRRNIIEQIKRNLPRLNTKFIGDLVNKLLTKTDVSTIVDLNTTEGYNVMTCLVYKVLFGRLLSMLNKTNLSSLKHKDKNKNLKNMLLILNSDAWETFFHVEWWQENSHYIVYEDKPGRQTEIHKEFNNEAAWSKECDEHNGQSFSHLVEWTISRIHKLDTYLTSYFGKNIEDWEFKI